MNNIHFGTAGFRAIIGEDFTKDNTQKICQAISNIILKQNKIKKLCIGYDNRFMSEQFAVWCSEVFAGNGIEVELFDSAVTTPVVNHVVKKQGYDFGIMITASHNPFMYNGLKVFIEEGRDAGVDVTDEIEKQISLITEIKSIDFEKANGNIIKHKNYIDDYLNNIVKIAGLADANPKFKVILDAKFGSSTEEINLLAKKIGLKNYKILNSKRDAFFGFKPPAPNIENIEELIAEVKKNKADIGFALDADGDRLAVIDENGNYIDNNYLLAIIYYFYVKYYGIKGDSVKNIATSNLINVITNKFGFKCHEVPVGFKYVSKALIDYNAIVGGELSGGLAVKGHILGKDSLIVVALCLKAMIAMNKPFSEILKEVKLFADNYSKVICDKEYSYSAEKKAEIEKIIYKDKKIIDWKSEIDHIDYKEYVKICYKNGDWTLIRFSGTEPILRIYIETDSNDEILSMAKKWEELLGL